MIFQNSWSTVFNVKILTLEYKTLIFFVTFPETYLYKFWNDNAKKTKEMELADAYVLFGQLEIKKGYPHIGT